MSPIHQLWAWLGFTGALAIAGLIFADRLAPYEEWVSLFFLAWIGLWPTYFLILSLKE